MAKGGAKKVVYEDWTEDCEQGRYFYGLPEKACSYCQSVIEPDKQDENPCHICHEWRFLYDVKGNV